MSISDADYLELIDFIRHKIRKLEALIMTNHNIELHDVSTLELYAKIKGYNNLILLIEELRESKKEVK